MPSQPFDIQENLIRQLGIGDLPVEKRVAIIEKATELVLKRAILRLLKDLTPEQREEAVKVIDDRDKLVEFLAQTQDVPKILAEEVEKAREELKASAQAV